MITCQQLVAFIYTYFHIYIHIQIVHTHMYTHTNICTKMITCKQLVALGTAKVHESLQCPQCVCGCRIPLQPFQHLRIHVCVCV